MHFSAAVNNYLSLSLPRAKHSDQSMNSIVYCVLTMDQSDHFAGKVETKLQLSIVSVRATDELQAIRRHCDIGIPL